MKKSINDEITFQGSTLVIGVKFPKVDDTYSFTELLEADRITAKYFIINTGVKYPISSFYRVLASDDEDYDNMYAFTMSTENLTPGVVMVELTAQIPAHGSLPARTEVAVCSTGIAVIKDE